MGNYTKRDTCRKCNSVSLSPIISLGEQYVSDFLTANQHGRTAPLDLALCDTCGLVQLRHTFSREALYKYYWYESGINEEMKRVLTEIAEHATKVADLKQGDTILDIGANDGTLLTAFEQFTPGLELVGFEPAVNLVKKAVERDEAIHMIPTFFSAPKFSYQPAKVVTSIAMMYDVDDVNGFVADVKASLNPDGVWVNQMNYLPSMLTQNSFDNIGHEHVTYFSFHVFKDLVEAKGLEVFDVVLNDVNGGCFRADIGFPGKHHVKESVRLIQEAEVRWFNSTNQYRAFAKRIHDLAERTLEFVRYEAERGRRIFAYGAGNRGNTILQYYNLNNKLIKAAVDRNPTKFGKRTVGTEIPIVSEEEMHWNPPDYLLILPYFYLKFFIQRETEFLRNGGKMIVPLPDLRIVDRKDLQ